MACSRTQTSSLASWRGSSNEVFEFRMIIVNAYATRLGSRAGPQEKEERGPQKKGGGVPRKGPRGVIGGVRGAEEVRQIRAFFAMVGGGGGASGVRHKIWHGGNPCLLVPNTSRQEADANFNAPRPTSAWPNAPGGGSPSHKGTPTLRGGGGGRCELRLQAVEHSKRHKA